MKPVGSDAIPNVAHLHLHVAIAPDSSLVYGLFSKTFQAQTIALFY